MILGLDLGSKTGVCLMRPAGPVVVLTTLLAKPKNKSEPYGLRFLAFREGLDALLGAYSPSVIAYEAVHRHVATDAAHIYGALQALTEMAALAWAIPTAPIGVGTWKKLVTGKGNADKTAVAVYAAKHWPKVHISDDNQADALCIAEAFRRRTA